MIGTETDFIIGQRYQELTDSLAIAGINRQDSCAGRPNNAPFNFIGVPGDFLIRFNGEGDLFINRSRRGDRESYGISKGEGGFYEGEQYSRNRLGLIARKFEKSDPSPKGQQLVAQRFAQLTDTLSRSLRYPDHHPEQIQKRLRGLYGFTMEYLRERAIVPKKKTVVAENIFGTENGMASARNIFTAGQLEQVISMQSVLIEVSDEYQDVELPFLGRVNIMFDEDIDRVFVILGIDFFPDRRREHGMGIRITRQTQNQYIEESESWQIWKNGDACFVSRKTSRRPGSLTDHAYGMLDRFYAPSDQIYNPHLVLMKFTELENALKGRTPVFPENAGFSLRSLWGSKLVLLSSLLYNYLHGRES